MDFTISLPRRFIIGIPIFLFTDNKCIDFSEPKSNDPECK